MSMTGSSPDGGSTLGETARTLYERLHTEIRGVVALDFPVGPLTTYRLGGNALIYFEPENESDLDAAKPHLAACPLDVLMIGRGSNLLISDSGFPGIAIRLGIGFNWIERQGGARGGHCVAAGGAVPLPVLARWCAKEGLTGIEFGAGIPASVGGAVRMNAGGHGHELAEVLTAARVVDFCGDNRTYVSDEIGLSYRSSGLPETAIVVSAEFELKPEEPAAVRDRITDITRWRREYQPGGAPNAGSVFKNPEGEAAGRLIEQAGLKGLRRGGARVSEKHANFFLADPGATASDVSELMGEVRKRVFEESGVLLEPEVRMVGAFDVWPEPDALQ